MADIEEKKEETNARVSEVDKLKLELAAMKVVAASSQEAAVQLQLISLQKDLAEVTRLRQESTESLKATRAEIEAKYLINLTTHQIRESDGMVEPRTPVMARTPGMMGRVPNRG